MQQVILMILLCLMSIGHKGPIEDCYFSSIHNHFAEIINKDKIEGNNDHVEEINIEEDLDVYITISAAGDCTLGTDKILEQYSYKTFMDEYEDQNKDPKYFFKNVESIFDEDDLTIVNLETTLTNATKKANKKYRFKGYPEFTEILTYGNIEAVNLANNHTYDYLEQGYLDTIKNLDQAEIGYFGYEDSYITDIKGVKIGLLGYTGWTSSEKVKASIGENIKILKEKGCKLIIVSFHWGNEYNFYPNKTQQELGRFVIDEGADLVLGHHPHVMQGIEKYNDKYIVYSLANFCFGGNLNPKDKDTFIFQQTFKFIKDDKQEYDAIRIIPCSVSSVQDRNNFQPTPVDDIEYERIIERLNQYSEALGFQYNNDN